MSITRNKFLYLYIFINSFFRLEASDLQEDPVSMTLTIKTDQQHEIIKSIEEHSWRFKNGQTLIQDYLIKILNELSIEELPPEELSNDIYKSFLAKLEDIVKLTSDDSDSVGKKYWTETLYRTSTKRYSSEDYFCGKTSPAQNFPSRLGSVLCNQELYRISHILKKTPLYSFEDFNRDDIVRLISISGTIAYCKQKSKDDLLTPSFTAMLDPGQLSQKKHYVLHTCIHGLRNYHLYHDMYFVPYGLPINKKYGFKCTGYYRSHDALNAGDKSDISFNAKEETYIEQGDYACVKIEPTTDQGRSLFEILINREEKNLLDQSPLFSGIKEYLDNETPSLPGFEGVKDKYNEIFNNFHQISNKEPNNEKDFKYLSCFARPGQPAYAHDEKTGFCFSVSRNISLDNQPFMAETDGSVVKVEKKIQSRPRNVAVTLPSTSGMSGGMIVKTISLCDSSRRLCRLLGTINGLKRIYSSNDASKNDLKNISTIVFSPFS